MLRARSGYDIEQLASEYRALRASVLQSWFDACGAEEPPLDDVIRFNEAIDQALAESIAFFSSYVERSRNLLLGILGHDMRSPLQSIRMTALFLGELNAGAEISKAASRMINSGARMQLLLDDLLDFNRVELGLGLNVAPAPLDLAQLCSEEVEEIRSAYPDARIELQIVGDGRGSWDANRMQQLLANLISNAVKYGEPSSPVRVALTAKATRFISASGTAARRSRHLAACSSRWFAAGSNTRRRTRASAWASTLRAPSPRLTAGRSKAFQTNRERSSRCGCRAGCPARISHPVLPGKLEGSKHRPAKRRRRRNAFRPN